MAKNKPGCKICKTVENHHGYCACDYDDTLAYCQSCGHAGWTEHRPGCPVLLPQKDDDF